MNDCYKKKINFFKKVFVTQSSLPFHKKSKVLFFGVGVKKSTLKASMYANESAYCISLLSESLIIVSTLSSRTPAVCHRSEDQKRERQMLVKSESFLQRFSGKKDFLLHK